MRYEPLTRRLEAQSADRVRLSFRAIEDILQRALPASARRHQAWWSNTDTHSHADAWLRVGWKTCDLDLAGEAVTFARGPARAGRGLAEPHGAPFRRRPTATAVSRPGLIAFDRGRLSPAARKLFDDYLDGAGGDAQAALERALGEAAVARRRRLIEAVAREAQVSGVDSALLIREDRDGR